jgi:hypothetical protein
VRKYQKVFSIWPHPQKTRTKIVLTLTLGLEHWSAIRAADLRLDAPKIENIQISSGFKICCKKYSQRGLVLRRTEIRIFGKVTTYFNTDHLKKQQILIFQFVWASSLRSAAQIAVQCSSDLVRFFENGT